MLLPKNYTQLVLFLLLFFLLQNLNVGTSDKSGLISHIELQILRVEEL